VYDAFIGGRFRRIKITGKASDAAENLQSYQVVQSFHPRLSCTTHIYAYIGGRSENNIKCAVVHNDFGWKNQTTRYNCRFSATSLALPVIFSVFLVVEHIWFFHGAIQFCFMHLAVSKAVN